jgi:hypothetical protein
MFDEENQGYAMSHSNSERTIKKVELKQRLDEVKQTMNSNDDIIIVDLPIHLSRQSTERNLRSIDDRSKREYLSKNKRINQTFDYRPTPN